MRKGKIIFTGDFWDYFGRSIKIVVVGAIGIGIATGIAIGSGGPALGGVVALVALVIFAAYCAYWSLKYFFEHLEIEIDSSEIQTGGRVKHPATQATVTEASLSEGDR